jgi:hypothetical protein
MSVKTIPGIIISQSPHCTIHIPEVTAHIRNLSKPTQDILKYTNTGSGSATHMSLFHNNSADVIRKNNIQG